MPIHVLGVCERSLVVRNTEETDRKKTIVRPHDSFMDSGHVSQRASDFSDSNL